MSSLPPWLGLMGAGLLFGALAAGLLRYGLRKQAIEAASKSSNSSGISNNSNNTSTITDQDVQAEAQRRIQQQHLADLAQAQKDGRLSDSQYAAARDELMRQVLADQADAAFAQQHSDGATRSVRWGWLVALLCALTAVSYVQLGASSAWWPLPLSQRVQISATTPEQLAEQTRVWQQATESRPRDAEAWLTLARLQAAQQAHALAEQALARVVALSPEPDLWIERAQMKAFSAGGVYTGEPWAWIEQVLREQPQHLNALVLAGTAALSEQRAAVAQGYWQRALALVPADSEAAQGLQQALSQAAQQAISQNLKPVARDSRRDSPSANPPDIASGGQADSPVLIQGEVRLAPALQSQIAPGARLFVYALAEGGSRRPVAIWRGSPSGWPVRFALSDSMGMGAPPLLSSLSQVRLVARISQSGSAQPQEGDLQVELPGVKTGVQGVVLHITAR